LVIGILGVTVITGCDIRLPTFIIILLHSDFVEILNLLYPQLIKQRRETTHYFVRMFMAYSFNGVVD
jgi:hypothetical protein